LLTTPWGGGLRTFVSQYLLYRVQNGSYAMNPRDGKVIGLYLLLIWFFASVLDSNLLAASAASAILQAKKEAEGKGYIFFTARDEIVALAKKEGKLRVRIGLREPNFKPLVNGFKQKYPFIADIQIEELQGPPAFQRFLLEIKSGQAKGWDTILVGLDFVKEFLPHFMKHDILGMAKHGVLKIHPGMIHPIERNIVSVTSGIRVVPYNKNLISEDRVPSKWDDFLKPEFKGKKFLADIRATGIAGLVPAWGLERTLDFARKIAAQQPVWSRGSDKLNTGIAAGEYSLSLGTNFNGFKRIANKDPTGNLSYKIVEPVPTDIVDDPSGTLIAAEHPHAALLWLEFLVSPEGQEIIDKYEPLRASIFTPGSVTEQLTRGKQLSVVDWDQFAKYQDHIAKVFSAFGFPKAD
jgi:iron(III) transport system substrate-binding protein